jgi:hypothetical protein
MHRLAVVVMVALMIGGCDGGQSLSPTAPTVTPAPRPTFTVSGTVAQVTPRGLMPLEGVVVRVGPGQATTDKNGYYVIEGLSFLSATIRATKAGYQFDPRDAWIDGRDTLLDFQGVPVTALTGFSVSASPSRVVSGGELTMSWVAPSGQGCDGGGDWIAIYKVGDPDITGAFNGHSDLWYTHLCGATSGTSVLSAPIEPGQYEFRYMIGDIAATRSGPVTVTAS